MTFPSSSPKLFQLPHIHPLIAKISSTLTDQSVRSHTKTMANDKPYMTIANTMLVYPKSDPPQQLLQLSDLDRNCSVLLYFVLLYRNNSKKKHFCEALKKGLEETLSVWWPAAGRIMCAEPEPEPGEKSVRLNIVCNNKSEGGVLFLEAVTDAHISDLGDIPQDNQSFLETLVFRPTTTASFPAGISEVPLVVAQVTEFGCGGYAIGVGINHSLFDGHGNFNFLSAWASNTAGREENDGKLDLVEPMHERKLLANYKDNQSESANQVMVLTHLDELVKQAISTLQEGSDKVRTASDEEEYVLRTLTISNEKIEKLKKKMGSSSCTSFEVVAAHLWKAKTRAMGLPNDRTVYLQFVVNVRTRLSPPLPSSFTGNAHCLSSVSSTCKDLIEEEKFSSIVHKIKAAKDSVNDDYFSVCMSALDAAPNLFSLPPCPELTMISSWRNFPYHKLDFGLGDAAWAVPLAFPRPEVVYFLQCSTEVGGIDVRINLMRKHVVDFVSCFLDVF